MVAFFHDLSADARCSRFLHPVNEPLSELLRQITQSGPCQSRCTRW
jgi:acetyltransferase